MVKIKSVSRFDEKNQYGYYTYVITTDDGKKHYYKCKEESQTYFKEGQDADAIVEEKQKNDGTGTYLTIRPNKPNQPLIRGGYPKNDKAIAASVSLQEATKYVCSRPELKTDSIFPLADKMYKWLEDKGAIPNG